MSLRTRLDLLVSGILLLMLLSVLYLSTWRQSQQSLQEQQTYLNATATALNQALKSPLIARDYATIDVICNAVFTSSDITRLDLLDGDRHPLIRLREAERPGAVPGWFRHWFDIPLPHSHETISAGGVRYGELTLAGSTGEIYLSLWRVAGQMSLLALLAYATLNVSVWWILLHGFRPLELLQQAAEKLARGVREPIDEQVMPELRLPIHAFNQMSEEISRLIAELTEKHADLRISAQAIESLSEGVVILNQDLSTKYYNPFAHRLQQDMPGLIESLKEILDRHLSHRTDASLHLVTDLPAVGAEHSRTLDILISSVRLPESEISYYVIVVRDISEERKQKAQLAWEATHDILTGSLNRLEFTRRLNEHIAVGQPGMLLFVDLDHFKRINEGYGHSVGDQFLAHLAGLLRAEIEEGDLLAHPGGDEFLVLLKNRSLESGTRCAERLLHRIPNMKLLHQGHLLHVTCSIGGIYFDGQTHLSAEMLISHTDATLFEAKQGGRNRLAIFEHAMPGMANIRVDQEWMSRLTSALEDDSIVPMFQPTLLLSDDTISHYEALARLRTAEGILDAAHFIGHAERLGLVGEIDATMLRQVMHTLAAHPQLVIASNLSAYSLNNRHLQKRLFEILEQYRQVAPRLILEITESTAIAEVDDAKSFIKRAKEHGCRFAIDDFGVGYSSLQSLSQLDVDYLKIDGSLLRTLHSENTALLMAVQGLADALNIPTVAEHVDSEEKLEVVRRIGIRFAQGYLVGRAQPLSEIIGR